MGRRLKIEKLQILSERQQGVSLEEAAQQQTSSRNLHIRSLWSQWIEKLHHAQPLEAFQVLLRVKHSECDARVLLVDNSRPQNNKQLHA